VWLTLRSSGTPSEDSQRIGAPLEAATRAAHLAVIEDAPRRFRSLVDGLSAADLDTPYRP
jgi:hypothetical protein